MSLSQSDITSVKQELRSKYKNMRLNMGKEEKTELDGAINRRFLESEEYKSTDTLFVYISSDTEVDTKAIIARAAEDGKTVAAPRCSDKEGHMDFYVISSFGDLEKGSFGLFEPNAEKCEILSDFSNGLCLVPALSFDKKGFRLGYGKGYYDRFLAKFKGVCVGLCYSCFLCEELPCGKYDEKVDILVTEKDLLPIISKSTGGK